MQLTYNSEIRKFFVQSLSSFIPFLNHNSSGSNTSLSLAQRLEISQKQHEFYDKLPTVNGDTNDNSGLEVAALQLDAVIDLPPVNTRAGLYVFLNSLVSSRSLSASRNWLSPNLPQLVARPLTDEYMITNYLHSRYKVSSCTFEWCCC